MNTTAELGFMLRHELRLAWRDVAAMLAGRRRNVWKLLLAGLVIALVLHLPAWALVAQHASLSLADGLTPAIITLATIFFTFALILSQAMESVTRVFYGRSDLDLIASSPSRLDVLFSIRMGAIALSVTVMAIILSLPLVDVLVYRGGVRWLSLFGLVGTVGIAATACALGLTTGLFRAIGPKRTRLVAQVFAAMIGAGFVIALQIAAVMSSGTLSRFAVLTTEGFESRMPSFDHPLWLPVRAAFGDVQALLVCAAASLLALGIAVLFLSPQMAGIIARAAATSTQVAAQRAAAPRGFSSATRALVWKELVLLGRDPWLVSQSLMQLLYLIPPGVLMWMSFDTVQGAPIVIAPVLVMAAGQLAGGLAWLTISGEDAPDLVNTAPVPASALIRAKIAAVMVVIAAIFVPLVVLLAWRSALPVVFIVSGGVACAAASTTFIQLWFRTQARRTQFRRRQTSSRFATFAEAFCAITWAGTTALALISIPVSLIGAAVGLLILGLTWRFSPARQLRRVR